MVFLPSEDFGMNPLLPEVQELLNDLIEEVTKDIKKALGSFKDLVKVAGNSRDRNRFGIINESLVILLDGAIKNGENLNDLLSEAFASWSKYLGDNVDAIEDLLSQLHDQINYNVEAFGQILEEFIKTVSDFPQLFQEIAIRVAKDIDNYRDGLEILLLPLLLSGWSAFGVDQCVDAIYLVLQSSSPRLRQRVSWFDMGISAAGVSDLQKQLLSGSAFSLPTGVLIVASLLETLRQASSSSNILPDGFTVPNPALHGIFLPVSNYLSQVVSDYLNNVDALLEALVLKFFEDAENDFEIEWLLLQLARFTPVGVLFILIGTTQKLITSPAPWLDLILNPVEEDPSLRVKRLPPPSEKKYIIFSDIHRDAASDANSDYQFGSIDHFIPNKELYLELLKHYAEKKNEKEEYEYIIIEAGDCEELWFHRDFTARPDQKLQEIINTHSDIYATLASLHARGQYYRVQGNHDSYLRDPDTFAILESAMNTTGSDPFEIYDFIIIEGVKLMQDIPLYLGLDSDPNDERRPMLIAHGHQWDFWNCDANNILGKLIVSAIVTPLDMLDDPFRDLAGISSKGSPFVNFKQRLGSLPVFNSWQSYEPAVQQLDAIQHMSDEARRFTDDVQYSETLASLMGLLIPITPSSDRNCGSLLPLLKNLLGNRCLFNLMLLGHTHNPHNEPYYDLKALPYVKEVLTGLQTAISEATLGLINVGGLGLVKSNYLNTGMTGWYENCIWAIDLGDESHGSGQPKLINWTRNTRIDRPNHMDWELPHIAREGNLTPGDEVNAYLEGLLELAGDFVKDTKDQAIDVFVNAPISEVIAMSAQSWKPIDLKIDFSQNSQREVADTFLFQCLLGLLPGQRGAFQATITLPSSLVKSLNKILRTTSHRNHPRLDHLSAAIGMLAVVEEMGRNGLRRAMTTAIETDGKQACLSFLLLLAQLQQQKAEIFNVSFKLVGNQLTATVNINGQQLPNNKLGQQPQSSRPQLGKPSEISRNTRLPQPALTQRTIQSAVALPDLTSQAKKPLPKNEALLVKAWVEQIGTPLVGWKVAIEQTRGSIKKELISALTNRQGEAKLLRLRSTNYGLKLPGHSLKGYKCSLVLYSPSGKEAIRKKFEPNMSASGISLPVSFAILKEIDFFKGRKTRTVEEKTQAVCHRWRKRLSNPRDKHVKDDLCLVNLMLGALSGLANPHTPMQNEIVNNLSKTLPEGADLSTVAEYATKARDILKDCLGNDYIECDGTGSLSELGNRLLEENGRFSGLKSLENLFGEPVPDFEEGLGDPSPGVGLPGEGIFWDKICETRFLAGEEGEEPLSEEARSQWEQYYPNGLLAPPSINIIEVRDANLNAIVRRTEVQDKILNLENLLKIENGNPESASKSINMDVELDSSECLVLEADETGRQSVITDISPGQQVKLYGSGFVSTKGKLQVDYRAWETEPDSGRLVPDQNQLPGDGFSKLEYDVYGQGLPVDDAATPTTYNGDRLVFTWPETAARDGLYRIRITFENESDYATSIERNEDCTLTISKDPVHTQYIYFAVLPPMNRPAVRVMARDVECIDLTDPEGFLGIPWPDDVSFIANPIHQRLVLPTDSEQEVQAETIPSEPITSNGTYQFWVPGTWTPNLQLFPTPNTQAFSPLEELEFLFISFTLQEVDGAFDSGIVSLLLFAAVAAAVVVLIGVLIIGAIGLSFLAASTLHPFVAGSIIAGSWGAVDILVPIILGGAGPVYFLLREILFTVLDGPDDILTGQVLLDGQRLMYRLSPVRFHQILYPLNTGDQDADQSLATMDEDPVLNEALGGVYKFNPSIEVE
ncbi:hypothetical protein [Crocosphaera sp.]|uniref:hypothetical protein n=1 Tax=Crocosphaera sp. TaxID=2729996 RepID=UPI00262438B4|nr:hypothetical protein [Crocosphaera sp.]MDJ0578597.1 hypothetical protein [Crocosphaera sp.]